MGRGGSGGAGGAPIGGVGGAGRALPNAGLDKALQVLDSDVETEKMLEAQRKEKARGLRLSGLAGLKRDEKLRRLENTPPPTVKSGPFSYAKANAETAADSAKRKKELNELEAKFDSAGERAHKFIKRRSSLNELTHPQVSFNEEGKLKFDFPREAEIDQLLTEAQESDDPEFKEEVLSRLDKLGADPKVQKEIKELFVTAVKGMQGQGFTPQNVEILKSFGVDITDPKVHEYLNPDSMGYANSMSEDILKGLVSVMSIPMAVRGAIGLARGAASLGKAAAGSAAGQAIGRSVPGQFLKAAGQVVAAPIKQAAGLVRAGGAAAQAAAGGAGLNAIKQFAGDIRTQNAVDFAFQFLNPDPTHMGFNSDVESALKYAAKEGNQIADSILSVFKAAKDTGPYDPRTWKVVEDAIAAGAKIEHLISDQRTLNTLLEMPKYQDQAAQVAQAAGKDISNMQIPEGEKFSIDPKTGKAGKIMRNRREGKPERAAEKLEDLRARINAERTEVKPGVSEQVRKAQEEIPRTFKVERPNPRLEKVADRTLDREVPEQIIPGKGVSSKVDHLRKVEDSVYGAPVDRPIPENEGLGIARQFKRTADNYGKKAKLGMTTTEEPIPLLKGLQPEDAPKGVGVDKRRAELIAGEEPKVEKVPDKAEIFAKRYIAAKAAQDRNAMEKVWDDFGLTRKAIDEKINAGRSLKQITDDLTRGKFLTPEQKVEVAKVIKERALSAPKIFQQTTTVRKEVPEEVQSTLTGRFGDQRPADVAKGQAELQKLMKQGKKGQIGMMQQESEERDLERALGEDWETKLNEIQGKNNFEKVSNIYKLEDEIMQEISKGYETLNKMGDKIHVDDNPVWHEIQKLQKIKNKMYARRQELSKDSVDTVENILKKQKPIHMLQQEPEKPKRSLADELGEEKFDKFDRLKELNDRALEIEKNRPNDFYNDPEWQKGGKTFDEVFDSLSAKEQDEYLDLSNKSSRIQPQKPPNMQDYETPDSEELEGVLKRMEKERARPYSTSKRLPEWEAEARELQAKVTGKFDPDIQKAMEEFRKNPKLPAAIAGLAVGQQNDEDEEDKSTISSVLKGALAIGGAAYLGAKAAPAIKKVAQKLHHYVTRGTKFEPKTYVNSLQKVLSLLPPSPTPTNLKTFNIDDFGKSIGELDPRSPDSIIPKVVEAIDHGAIPMRKALEDMKETVFHTISGLTKEEDQAIRYYLDGAIDKNGAVTAHGQKTYGLTNNVPFNKELEDRADVLREVLDKAYSIKWGNNKAHYRNNYFTWLIQNSQLIHNPLIQKQVTNMASRFWRKRGATKGMSEISTAEVMDTYLNSVMRNAYLAEPMKVVTDSIAKLSGQIPENTMKYTQAYLDMAAGAFGKPGPIEAFITRNVYRGALWANVSSAVINTTQQANIIAEYGFKNYKDGWKKLMQLGFNDARRAGALEILDTEWMHSLRLMPKPTQRFMRKLDKVFMSPMIFTESLNRVLTFYTAREAGLSKGLNAARATEEALSAVNRLMFNTSSSNIAPVFAGAGGLGLIGRTARVLTQFPVRQTTLVGGMASDVVKGIKEGDFQKIKPFMRYVGVMAAVMGGMKFAGLDWGSVVDWIPGFRNTRQVLETGSVSKKTSFIPLINPIFKAMSHHDDPEKFLKDASIIIPGIVAINRYLTNKRAREEGYIDERDDSMSETIGSIWPRISQGEDKRRENPRPQVKEYTSMQEAVLRTLGFQTEQQHEFYANKQRLSHLQDREERKNITPEEIKEADTPQVKRAPGRPDSIERDFQELGRSRRLAVPFINQWRKRRTG